MRAFLSMVLLALFTLPAVAPLFSLQASAESRLPACCRKTGVHRCELTLAERAAAEGYPGFWAVRERCPYAPSTAPRGRTQVLSAPIAQALYPGLVRHPAAVAQTESLRRISRDRTRQKRGPPAVSFS